MEWMDEEGPPGGVLCPGLPFTGPELCAMESEGIVRAVLPGAYVARGRPVDAAVRAAAAGAVAGPRPGAAVVVGRCSAAWVLGCAAEPAELELLASRFVRRPLVRPALPVRVYEARLQPEDVVELGGVGVTSPVRTAADVARHGDGAVALEVLARLLAQGDGCTPAAVADRLARMPRHPGKARAERILAQAAA